MHRQVIFTSMMLASFAAFADWIKNSNYMDEDVATNPWRLTISTVNSTDKTFKITASQAGDTTDLDISDFSEWSLDEISANTFNKKAITSVKLPQNTLTTIGKDAFSSCSSLTNVDPFLPASLTSLGATAFYSSPITSSLTLSNPALTTMVDNRSYGVFTYCRFKTADLSGNSVTKISRAAFQGNSALMEVHFPETLTTINQDAFSQCTSLTNMVPFLPAAVTSIEKTAFYNCPIRCSLTLSNPSLTSIPDNGVYGVFYGGRFASADLSESGISTVRRAAFQANNMLTHVVLPKTLTSLGQDALYNCSALCDIEFLSAPPTFGGNCLKGSVGDYMGRLCYPATKTAWADVGTGSLA